VRGCPASGSGWGGWRWVAVAVLAWSGGLVAWGTTDRVLPNVEGVMRMGATPYAFLSLPGPERWESGWLRPGQWWEGFMLVDISATSTRVTVQDTSGQQLELGFYRAIKPVATPAPVPPVVGLVPLADLDWDWIRSEANGMRDQVTKLPLAVAMLWPTLDEQVRVRITNHYRVRGIDLRVEHGDGYIGVTHGRLRDPKVPVQGVRVPIYRISDGQPLHPEQH
jgi:hypothetical protein